MEPLGLNHVAIKALDIQRTAEFYVQVLGLTETHRNVDERGLRSIWLRIGPVIVMIERSSATAEHKPRPFHHDPPGLHLLALTIAPDSRTAWMTKLQAHGCKVVHQTDYTIYIQDPEGNRVGLSSWPEPSWPEPSRSG